MTANGTAMPTGQLYGVGCMLTVVPPGKRAFPYHRHHVIDELFYVIEGEGPCRIGDASFPIRAGELIAAPAGTEAHQIVKTSKGELRYPGFLTLGGADSGVSGLRQNGCCCGHPQR